MGGYLCEFFERIQVGIDVYIPHRKYQVKPNSSLWFSAACIAAIVHRNNFFVFKRVNFLNLKESSDRLVIVAKRFLKLLNLHMPIKQKNPSLSRNLALETFDELPIVFSTKINLLCLLYSMACLLVLSSASDKAKLFAGSFSKNSNLDD